MKKFFLIVSLIAFSGDVWASVRVATRIEVMTTQVTLGDIFTGVEAALAEVVVVDAPPKGRTVRLPISWVVRVASTYGISWTPSPNRMPTITIYHLTDEQQRRRLHDDLARMITKSLKAKESSAPARENNNQEIVAAPQLSSSKENIEIPVLVRSMAPGEVISRRDLEWQTIKIRANSRHALTQMEDVVGKTPVRRMNAGRGFMPHQLTAPPVIKSGETVTVVVKHGGMTLTSVGRALESGAIGETISVINISSKKTVQAVAIAPNRARIVLPSALLAYNETNL